MVSGSGGAVLAGLLVLYVGYVLLGAAVFRAVEQPQEQQVQSELRLLKQRLLENVSCINSTALDQLLNALITANRYGVSLLENGSDFSNWDLPSALFFSNTLLTTIGYGHTTPLSDAGKVFAIVYAVFGVPFTMLVLTVCVQRLMVPLNLRPVTFLRRKFGLLPHTASLVHFVILFPLVILVFLLLPALVFKIMEQTWSYLEAFYFCFISLCTIGLGDFVPGEQPNQQFRPLYKISVMVYLFLGLMAMCFLLRSFHKLADVQGWTACLRLPSCDDEDDDEDHADTDVVEPAASESDTRPLDPKASVSYNSISR